MRKTYNFISKNPELLFEMLMLRKAGWTFVALSDLYGCDRTSLRYQCRKYQIFPIKTVYKKNSNEVFNPSRIVTSILIELNPKEEGNWKEVDGEKINTGMSYAEYRAKFSPYHR